MVFSMHIIISSFWGLRPQTPTRALPLDPAGDLVPRFCPPPKQISGYAPGPLLFRQPHFSDRSLPSSVHLFVPMSFHLPGRPGVTTARQEIADRLTKPFIASPLFILGSKLGPLKLFHKSFFDKLFLCRPA